MTMYEHLADGGWINKSQEAARFGVDNRSIQRDIEDIRAFLANHPEMNRELVYDRTQNGYHIVQNHTTTLTNSEVFAVCKILLESRAMVKGEMYPIIDKLLKCCVSIEDYRKVAGLIGNEKLHYLEPHHGRKFVDTLWNIGTAVNEHKLMRMRYQKLKEPDKVKRLIQPVGIMFSEYYFYLCAYISESEENPALPKHQFPTIYRIDRIAEYEVLDEHFKVPYADRFEEGEFRKRIQFMFGGELRTVKFLYKGISIESILDRFPTAEILKHDENGWLVKAEVYGNGVDIGLRGQGDILEVIGDDEKDHQMPDMSVIKEREGEEKR